MPTAQELEQLADHIRATIPDRKHMSQLKVRPDAGIAEFMWHARHFVAKTTLEVFEVKGPTVLITGASMLMQAALRTKERNTKVIEAVIESIKTAEEQMRASADKGLALLQQVKGTLKRLSKH